MSARTREAARRRSEVEDLQHAVTQMFGAERRLRSRDHSRPGELTHAQLRALFALGREQAMTAGQLARSADLNPATITGLLDQLEAAEVVQRHRSSEDRRICNVSLTDKGSQLLERKRTAWQSLWDERFADISDQELAAVARVIDQITEIYNEVAGRLEAGKSRESHARA
jgi:DNA-binding MarR family transcriptional regulator